MNNNERSCCMAGLAGSLAVAAAVPADFLGIFVEQDFHALDEVTPLDIIPGYKGQRVLNVYARFSEPADQVIGVVGTPEHPFLVHTGCWSGFENPGPLGAMTDAPPTLAEISIAPDLNWDSFFTIGLRISVPGDVLIVAPGTPGPDTDPWPDPADDPKPPYLPRGENMAWLVPPAVDGVPTSQSVAGDELRVLIMRLVTDPAERIDAAFGLITATGGEVQDEIGATFSVAGCTCPADVAPPAGIVDVQDLVTAVLNWGEGGPGDVNDDGVVDVDDLVLIILAWGECL